MKPYYLHLFTFAFAATLLAPLSAQAYYNPSTGRWLSRDPVADKATLQFAKAASVGSAFRRERDFLAAGPLSAKTALGPSRYVLTPKRLPPLRVARETANCYRFVHNATTTLVDPFGLKPCSSCSADDIQREGIARGLQYIHRTIEENREYGARICCNDCLSRVYSANVVYGPVGEGTVIIANSKCRLGDKVVADWHTHPDGSTQTGEPNQRSDDRRSVMASASPNGYDCDYVGFMTNSHLDTTKMDGQGVETTVGTNSGDMPPLSE